MLLLVDGNNLAYRCKYAFSLSNQGIDTSVTYGFFRTLLSVMRDLKPTSIIVCWDGGIPLHRLTATPSYKSNREHKDEDDYLDMLRQMRELHDILPHAGIISIRVRGVEADDLLYHASVLSADKSVIYSNDEDMIQAIRPGVSVYTAKNKLLDEAYVVEEYGVKPCQIPHWKALVGDGSDNIQGVPGIGKVTAKKLFQAYGSLSGIWNAAHGKGSRGSIGGATGERIREFGWSRLVSNVVTISLWQDKTGARLHLLEAIEAYSSANKKVVKRYFFDNDFNSLMGETGVFTKLVAPVMSTADLRMPVVYSATRIAA